MTTSIVGAIGMMCILSARFPAAKLPCGRKAGTLRTEVGDGAACRLESLTVISVGTSLTEVRVG
ncbi:hypothetical protein GCM10009761_14180 [Agromyces terreus]